MRAVRPAAVLALWLGLSLAAPRAAAMPLDKPPSRRHRVLYSLLAAAQYNPLGLQGDLRLLYRYRLLDHPSPLLNDTFVGGGLITRQTPAYARIGAMVELQPLTVLTLRAIYEYRSYFRTFGMVQSFASPNAEHDNDTRSRLADEGRHYAAKGHQVMLQAVVRAKVGPVAVLNETELHYFDLGLRPGDSVFYEAYFDALAPGHGSTVVNNAHLLYLTDFGLIAGLRYTVVAPLYSDEMQARSEVTQTPSHRVGPLAGYTFAGRGPLFRAPTLVVFLNWWLRSRYRAGQTVHQAVPYGVVAFQVSGDLWGR